MQIKEDYLNLSLPLIKMALDEDLKTGDITAQTILPRAKNNSAKIIAKSNGILCGLDVFKTVFEQLQEEGIAWNPKKKDGDNITGGELIAEISASFLTLLSGERTALNFLQRMSGVATKTNLFVNQLEGTKAKLLDTRKTIPGFRYLDKYSVLVGGGSNHRFGLYDMVLIKENHIVTAGSITNAVREIRNKFHDKFKIEIETTNADEVKEAVRSKVDVIMLDNMPIKLMEECVKFINGRNQTEASGNINLDNIRSVGLTGVDFISVGSITHSVEALDISLLINI